MASTDSQVELAKRFLAFVDASPSPFHAVHEAKCRLQAHGYEKIREAENWSGLLKKGGKYFFTRNSSTIVAFAVGGSYTATGGFRVIGAHTDSPALKVKPNAKKSSEGYHQVGVQVYGGGQWCTWFDRDLKVAGRVMVRDANNQVSQQLVHINRPVMRVPTLAIHLNRGLNDAGFKFNLETELVPIIATTLQYGAGKKEEEEKKKADQPPVFLEMVAKELNTTPDHIVDYDFALADCQPSSLGGLNEEFIFAPRLDNLMMSFVALDALLDSENTLADEEGVRMCVLFDNEEIGSVSYMGANSDIIERSIRRTANAFHEGTESADVAFQNSFMISADMAHAVHPNYSSKHEGEHKPHIHKGLVVKSNANMRYATTAATSAGLKELARRHNIPIQDFVVRNDAGCGSTIGPTLSSRGLRTVDVGQPQLSMHSIREMCGVNDCEYSKNLFLAYYNEFVKIDKPLQATVD